MKVLIFDIGGTHTKWGLIDQDYNILEKGHFETFLDDSDEKILNLYNRIAKFVNESELDFERVGISTAGVIDIETGEVLNDNPTFKGYVGFNIYDFMKRETGHKVIAINDGNSGALGEVVKGSLKGTKNSIMVVIGTGIGGGIISDSKIYTGNDGWAGEIGFSIVNGEQWEKMASTRALVNNVSEELGENVDGVYVFTHLDNPIVKKHYDKFISDIATGLINLFMFFGPEKIAIGGGISNNESFNVNLFKEAMKSHVTERIYNKINLCKATLGNDANLIGIASLLLKEEA